MKFELLPVLDIMIDFYSKPISDDRFAEYIQLLQGGTNKDLQLPIAGFNPMAKSHVSEKIAELKKLKIEEFMSRASLR